MPASVASTATMGFSTTAMETSSSMKSAITTMEAVSSMKSPVATMETALAVEPTITSEASAIKPVSAAIAITTTIVIPAVITTTIAPAIEVTTVESMEPRASSDEDSVYEPIRTVVAVRRTSVWVIIIVAISAHGSRTNVSISWANSNAHDDSLCVRERCRTQSDTE